MYKDFLFSEWKKWARDSMMKFMLIYPFIFGAIGRYLLPIVAENTGFVIELYADLILVVLALLIPTVYGAILGFSIIDDRDDHILTSIRVTPLSVHHFLSFKVAMVFLFSFLSSIFVMWFSDIGDLALRSIVSISFLAALAAPMTGLLINAFSKNKIEAFAVMKGLGTTILFPIISLFFLDTKELFFSFVPGFWPAKAISSLVRGEELLLLTFNQYYFLGLIYVVLLSFFVYRFFLARTRI